MTRVDIYGSNVHSSLKKGTMGTIRTTARKGGMGYSLSNAIYTLDSLTLYCCKVILAIQFPSLILLIITDGQSCLYIKNIIFASQISCLVTPVIPNYPLYTRFSTPTFLIFSGRTKSSSHKSRKPCDSTSNNNKHNVIQISPQAKRHKRSLPFTSLTILISLIFIAR